MRRSLVGNFQYPSSDARDSVRHRKRPVCVTLIRRYSRGHGRIRRSCSVQEYASGCASPVTVRPAGAVPSMIAEISGGETNASGASSRICRSTFPSRVAISEKELTRPWTNWSIQIRAFAIALSSRVNAGVKIGRPKERAAQGSGSVDKGWCCHERRLNDSESC